jgi:hypothetical protein
MRFSEMSRDAPLMGAPNLARFLRKKWAKSRPSSYLRMPSLVMTVL